MGSYDQPLARYPVEDTFGRLESIIIYLIQVGGVRYLGILTSMIDTDIGRRVTLPFVLIMG